jgi:hypothetical protein
MIKFNIFKCNILYLILVYLTYKTFNFIFFENSFIFISGILLCKSAGLVNVFLLPCSHFSVYIGIISIKLIILLLVHSMLYWSIVGLQKIIYYLVFVLSFFLINFYITANFGSLTSNPGFFNLLFHIWDLAFVLVVNNGFLPFLIYIYRNETSS